MRWNAKGDALATSSEDETVRLIDFKAEKPIYSEKTSDGGNYSPTFPIFFKLINSSCYVCLLYLRKRKSFEETLESCSLHISKNESEKSYLL